MNWGMKIVVGLGTFMLFVIGAGIYMVSQDTDSLIDDDYYEKGLTYDEVYNRKQNLIDDAAKPRLSIQSDTLSIWFVGTENRGELNFKRPSDGSMDLKIPFYTATNVFKLPISTFSRGSWILELTWESNKRGYTDTQSLFLQ